MLTARNEEPACVFVFTATPEGAYSRMFAPEYGIVEDPATGSSTGPLAAYMIRHRLAPGADGARFLSEQGTFAFREKMEPKASTWEGMSRLWWKPPCNSEGPPHAHFL